MHDQNPKGGHCDRCCEGVPRMNDVRDEGFGGHRKACTTDQWRKLEIPLFHGDEPYT